MDVRSFRWSYALLLTRCFLEKLVLSRKLADSSIYDTRESEMMLIYFDRNFNTDWVYDHIRLRLTQDDESALVLEIDQGLLASRAIGVGMQDLTVFQILAYDPNLSDAISSSQIQRSAPLTVDPPKV